MKRIILIALAVIVNAALLFPIAAAAQERTRTGTMSIVLEGKVIGAERYEIYYRENGNVRATGTISLSQEVNRTELLTDLKLKGPNGSFEAYQIDAEINQVPNTLSIVLEQDGKARVRVVAVAGERDEVMEFHADALVVENSAFHLYQLVSDRYDFRRGGRQQQRLILGTSLVEHQAWIEARGRAPISLAGKSYNARRLYLSMESFGAHIWVDDDGELMRVEIPIQGLVASRTDYSGLEVQAGPAPKYQPDPELTYSEVRFKSGDYELAGTLSMPRQRQGRLPGIVFVNDSGPQDRHGVVPKIDLYTGTGELLDQLSRAGYVVLRYDEPGIGASSGEFALSKLSTAQADVSAALDLLAGRPEVDPQKLVLIGQGEGALVAGRVAAARPGLAALALLAPSAMPLDELAEWQARRRNQQQGGGADDWKSDPVAIVLERARNSQERWTVIAMKPVDLDVFRDLIASDPRAEIAKLRQPLFVAEAGRDAQLPAGQGELLARAARQSGNKHVTFARYAELDHFFRRSGGSIADYADESLPVDRQFIESLLTWLKGAVQ